MFCQAPDSRGVLGAGRFPRVARALPPSFRRSVTGLAGRSSPVDEGFRTEGEMVLVRSPCGQRVRKHRAARRKISDVVFVVLSSTELRLARIIALSYPLIFSRPKCNWRLALRCDDSRVTSPEARVRGSELSRKRSRDAQCGTLGPSVRPF